MRTTIIFLGMCIFGIAGMIFLSTKKGQEVSLRRNAYCSWD